MIEICYSLQAEEDGDKITDMILNDVLFDTVGELQSMEDNTRVSHRAAAALQNPTLENLFQRLEEMEVSAFNSHLPVL